MPCSLLTLPMPHRPPTHKRLPQQVTIFVKDMQLARRLRGDRSADYIS